MYFIHRAVGYNRTGTCIIRSAKGSVCRLQGIVMSVDINVAAEDSFLR
jgi:hypothetical protein